MPAAQTAPARRSFEIAARQGFPRFAVPDTCIKLPHVNSVWIGAIHDVLHLCRLGSTTGMCYHHTVQHPRHYTFNCHSSSCSGLIALAATVACPAMGRQRTAKDLAWQAARPSKHERGPPKASAPTASVAPTEGAGPRGLRDPPPTAVYVGNRAAGRERAFAHAQKPEAVAVAADVEAPAGLPLPLQAMQTKDEETPLDWGEQQQCHGPQAGPLPASYAIACDAADRDRCHFLPVSLLLRTDADWTGTWFREGGAALPRH